MSKRGREDGEGDTNTPVKRARGDDGPRHAPTEEIEFARQLTQLLSFRQDGLPQLLHGIRSFKAFLESILYRKNEDTRERQLSILREYLESQKPADLKDTERPFLGQLWQAWSFGVQNHNDSLSISVSAVIALLVRVLSNLLDFRDFGYLLCRTTLQHQHMRLVKSGLDAPKHKDFVIAPCLRLLTEITTFDGGNLATEVYKRREQTFDVPSLRRNLGLFKTDVPEDELKRKPAIRTLTVRYVLAHLKYQHEGAKIDILKSRPLCVALLHQLGDDPLDLVVEILAVTEQYILKDKDVPRSAKATLLNQHNLERVTDVATRSNEDGPAAEKAFAWLNAVCTVQSYGILRESGWYPPGTTQQDVSEYLESRYLDLGLDSLQWYNSAERPDIRNTILLAWIQTLRPQTNQRERQLVLTCFKSAPELVAAYFAEKSMQLDHNMSNIWIGYAAFLFETQSIPLPDHLGNVEGETYAAIPPQSKIVLENLLPKPLSQKFLTRCLNQSNEIIMIFGVRLLVVAFQKLSELQTEFRKAIKASSDTAALWQEALQLLETEFTARVPPIKDVMNLFRKINADKDSAKEREAAARLLRSYYEVTPLSALEEQFDASAALTAALSDDVSGEEDDSAAQVEKDTLQHLLAIAQHNSGMRWFTKQGSLPYAPLTMVLKSHVSDHQNGEVRTLIFSVLQRNDVLQLKVELDALIASLVGIEPDDSVWAFVEDCMSRVSRQPIKYVDLLETATVAETAGMLGAAIVEQAAFHSGQKKIIEWSTAFLDQLYVALGQPEILGKLRKQSAAGLGRMPKARKVNDELLDSVRMPDADNEAVSTQTTADEPSDLPFTLPPTEPQAYPQLARWTKKDLDVAIEDGDVTALLLCLCSQQGDIRGQGLAQLRILGSKLLASALDDKDHMYVLIGEVVETFQQHYLSEGRAFPYVAGVLAGRVLKVVADPTHFMYSKVNRFLMRGPDWRVQKLPTYFLNNTVHAQPSEDDGHWKEIQWVLEWLIDGLRTKEDVDILKRGGVFERLMSLYTSPAASTKLVKEKILELLYRASSIDGGANVLVTRTGTLAWLKSIVDPDMSLPSMLRAHILDRSKVGDWSRVTAKTSAM